MTLSEARRAAIEAACREWAAANGVPDDDWKSRAGYVAGAVAEAERAEALVAVLEKVYELATRPGTDPGYARGIIRRHVEAALAPYREAEAG